MSAAHKSESPGFQPQANADISTHNIVDFTAALDSDKGLALLKARFEKAGHHVRDGDNDDYIVVKSDWCMSRYCADYSALVSFGRVLGVFK